MSTGSIQAVVAPLDAGGASHQAIISWCAPPTVAAAMKPTRKRWRCSRCLIPPRTKTATAWRTWSRARLHPTRPTRPTRIGRRRWRSRRMARVILRSVLSGVRTTRPRASWLNLPAISGRGNRVRPTPIFTRALERELRPEASRPAVDHFEIDPHGWPILKRQPGGKVVVSNEFVNELRESEGI